MTTRSRSGALAIAKWGFLLLCLLGCGSRADEVIGGETHFLQRCGAPDHCGALECMAEVCTQPCSDDSQCAGLPGAVCALTELESSQGDVGRCDVWCSTDDDCRVVSPEHQCVAGTCRPASFEVSVPDKTKEPVSSGDSPSLCPNTARPLDRRVVLGDTFFATSEPLASALGESSRYRDYARLVFNGLALGGRGLEDQYLLARAEGPVDLVIMAGGGADVLLGSCESLVGCPVLTDAVGAAGELLDLFARDGVGQVIYTFYPDPVPEAVRERMDALRPLIAEMCRRSPVPCQFVDLRPAFEGNYETYIQPDGLNPTPLGTQVVASAIRSTLGALCLEP